jgi:hypothetical protein
VRDVILWALGGLLAFLATAGAFLLLANFGDGAMESDPIPRAKPSTTPDREPPVPLVLTLSEDQLESLQRRPGQRLTLNVENGSDEELPSVELTLGVVSENTARPNKRSYQQTLEPLTPGEATEAEFEIDLSLPMPAGTREKASSGSEEQTREVLEIQAITSKGDSVVKTAVLAP